MATAVQVQYRRGTASQVASFTGAQGEMVIDTTNNRVVVQDGATAGGWPAALASRVAVSDSNYTLSAPYAIVAYTALTAARVLALCVSTGYPAGQRLLIVDESGACSAARTITVAASGSDTIDGAASAVINQAYGHIALETNAAGKWTIIDQGPQVNALNALTGQLTLAATDGAVIAASGTTVAIGGPGGAVNKFRNGAMDVWQRGAAPTLTAGTSGSGYTADGWIVGFSASASAAPTIAQAAGRLLTKSSLQITGATSLTDVYVKQRIESLIAAAFCGQTVTVQAQIYNNTAAAVTPTLTVKRPSTQDGWSGTINTDVNAVSLQSCANGAWTLLAYTFVANAVCYNGLEITIDFGNNFSSSSKSVQISECDIRVTPGASAGLNPSPPPPELRPIGTELAFCQRYYETIGYSAWGFIYATSGCVMTWHFTAAKRTAPTIALATTSPVVAQFTIGNFTGSGSSLGYNSFTADGGMVAISGFSFTSPTATNLGCQAQTNPILTASAEL